MEDHSPSSPDRPSRGPEPERLFPGEVDLTGATEQPDVLRDVIGDAIAEATDGTLPDWGARTIARALANRHGSFGALHQFAVTGRVDKAAMARQLVEIYTSTPVDDDETREWVNWLGVYVINIDQPATPDANEDKPATQIDSDAFAEGRHDGGESAGSELERGIRTYGDAFRAFLQLDARPASDDLLRGFNECYVGSFTSMDALLQALTPIRECEAVVSYVTTLLGFDGLVTFDWAGIEHVAHETWDIVSYGNKLYAFMK